MNIKYFKYNSFSRLLVFKLAFVFGILSANIATAQDTQGGRILRNNLDQVNSPGISNGIVKIGIRQSVAPIGKVVNKNRVDGYCGVFGEKLANVLKRINYKVQFETIANEHNTLGYERFDGLRKGNLGIECGANSKSVRSLGVAREIKFSKPFYRTGIKVLARKELVDELNNAPGTLTEKLNSLTIGVIRETTTEKRIKELNLNSPKIYNSSKEAIDDLLSLNNPRLVFASDAPILRTTIKEGMILRKGEQSEFKEAKAFEDFVLYPEESATYITETPTEEYVIAIKDDPLLQPLMDVINSILENANDPEDRLYLSAQEIRSYENQEPLSLDRNP